MFVKKHTKKSPNSKVAHSMHISKVSIKMIRVKQYIFKILVHEPLLLIRLYPLGSAIIHQIKMLVDMLINIRMFGLNNYLLIGDINSKK